MMFTGTTPTFILTFGEGVDFSDAKSVVVTFATDYCKELAEKTDEDLEINENIIRFSLTQEESLAMSPGRMLLQVNVLYNNGSRVASEIVSIEWDKNLKGDLMI